MYDKTVVNSSASSHHDQTHTLQLTPGILPITVSNVDLIFKNFKERRTFTRVNNVRLGTTSSNTHDMQRSNPGLS